MKLNVPFRSQWGANADASKNDCGPAALCSILAAYGIHKTVDEVFRATGAAPDALINFQQMIRAGKAFGLKLTHQSFNLAAVKQFVENKTPIIALINYRHFPGKQDTYNGAHFVVVFGQTPTKVIVHDPNRLRGKTYGDSIELSDETFFNMWGRSNEEHGNANDQVLVPSRPLNITSPTLTRREAIAAAYKGVLGRVPSKSELDRWDTSQKGIDTCINELLASLEYPQKIATLEEKIKRLEKITGESDGIISGHLNKINEFREEVDKLKAKIVDGAGKLEAAEKSAENALDKIVEVERDLVTAKKLAGVLDKKNALLLQKLANKDDKMEEAIDVLTKDFEARLSVAQLLDNMSGVGLILEGFSRIFRGGESGE